MEMDVKDLFRDLFRDFWKNPEISDDTDYEGLHRLEIP